MGIFNFKKEEDAKETKEVKAAAPKTAGVSDEQKAKPIQIKKDATETAKEHKGKDRHGIIFRPIITERTSALNALNQYVFEVAESANKIMVAEAVFSRYGVKPAGVNICNYPGRNLRYGKNMGRTKSWKKAIVTLPEGKSINVYEGPAK